MLLLHRPLHNMVWQNSYAIEFQKIMHLMTLLGSMYNKMHPMAFSRSPSLSSFADCVTFDYLALVLLFFSLILVVLICIMYRSRLLNVLWKTLLSTSHLIKSVDYVHFVFLKRCVLIFKSWIICIYKQVAQNFTIYVLILWNLYLLQ